LTSFDGAREKSYIHDPSNPDIYKKIVVWLKIFIG